MIEAAAPAEATNAPPRLRCRKIGSTDAPAIVRLLAKGFPARTTAYWATAIARLLDHAAVLTDPTCGHVLDCNGDIVGVLLLIPSSTSPATAPRWNVSSWYVEPTFQGYAPLLVNQALKRKDVTFFNISPAAHTRKTVEAQGFVRYGNGRLMCLPWLGAFRPSVRVRRFEATARDMPDLKGPEREMMLRHRSYGCLALCVVTPEGTHPFLFLPRLIKGLVPSAQLIYCRAIDDFVALSGPVGRHLLALGMPIVSIDANGPVAGLVGKYITDRTPKYFKGPHEPRLGDISDTELVMFGP